MRRSEAIDEVKATVPDGFWYGKGSTVRGSIALGVDVRCSHLIITYPCESPYPTKKGGRFNQPRTIWTITAVDWGVEAEGPTLRKALKALIPLVVKRNQRSLEAWVKLGGVTHAEPSYRACPECGDEDAHDLDRVTGLCGQCLRHAVGEGR